MGGMPRTSLPDHEVFTNARLVLLALIRDGGARRDEVAEAMRMSLSTLHDRLYGRSHLTLADVHRAAEFFKVDPQEFFVKAGGSPPRGSPAENEETARAA